MLFYQVNMLVCLEWSPQLIFTLRSTSARRAVTIFVNCDTSNAHFLQSLLHHFVTSWIDYCNVVFVGALKSVTNKLQRVLNAAARVVSGTRKFLPVVWHNYYTPTFSGLTCLSVSSTNSAWWCVDARTSLLYSIWRCTGHQSPRLHRDSTFIRLLVISWQCRHIGGSHTADGRLLSLTRQRGTHCQNVYVTPPLVILFLAVFSKQWRH